MKLNNCGKGVLALAFMALSAFAEAEKIDVMCVYYPHWHAYPKGDEWLYPGFNEWDFCRDAKARVPGQKCPLTPLYGFLDGKNPNDVAKEIDLASNCGIDVFLWDWYWYGGEMTMQESLEEGFLKAPNRDKMKFCIMWCYHDRVDSFRDDPRQPKRMLMKLPRTPEDFLANIRYCVKFFKEPTYYFRNGMPFFSIYNSTQFIRDMGGSEKAKAVLDEARKIAHEAGFKGIAFQGMNPFNKEGVETIAATGFDFIGSYSAICAPPRGKAQKNKTLVYEYEELIEPNCASWKVFADSKVPYIPSIPAGRDTTMRCSNDEPFPWTTVRYPYCAICLNNTPDKFQRLLARAKEHVLNDPNKPGAILIYGWNEYTEGGYIAPNEYDADGALRAVAAVFGRNPASEYTFVDPSTRELMTIPSATYENVAYGPHSKQKVDVFLPKSGKAPYPTIVYVHGGNWTCGTMEDHALGNAIRGILKKGIAVVAVGYRYAWDAKIDGVNPPEAAGKSDIAQAIAFVKSKAGEWKLDAGRMKVAGGAELGDADLAFSIARAVAGL